MSTGLFSIGVSGLNAAQLNLLATEHNVVNANTPGYTRQRVVQGTNVALNSGAGSLGQGVHVQTIERMYDKFLTSQVNAAQTQTSSLDTYYSQIKQIDSMLADPLAGLSPALQDFFSGVQQVAANPSSLPARQSMISSAQTMATRFHNLDLRLTEIGDQVNGRISNAVAEVNSYAAQIADVNQQIVISESGYGQPANDLMDQRDQLVNELNKLIKVSTTTNADGSFNVFIGTGQQLVVGPRANELTATASKADPTKTVVGLKTAGGVQEFPESMITGGELGGLVSFRKDSLEVAANEMGRVAASLALTFNAQNALGQDLLGKAFGETGFVGKFFTVPDPKIIANSGNTGTGALTAGFADPTAPSAPNYSGNFSTNLTNSSYQIQFGASGAYTITRLSDNVQVRSGTGTGNVPAFDGVSLAITTSGANGDKFIIQPVTEAGRNIGINTQITADPRLVAAGAPVAVTPRVDNDGSMKVSQGLVGVGYDASALPLTLSAEAATPPTTLSGISGTWTAIYSDGQNPDSGTGGTISLTNTSGGTLSRIVFSEMSFEISGVPKSGDSFVIDRNKSATTVGVQDGRNAVLFAKLQTQNTVAGGTATFQSAYARLVADNGIRTREAKVKLDAQNTILDQAQSTRDSLSGVNLDEEAANMLRYQQAYQASSKILEIGNRLFDTILSIG